MVHSMPEQDVRGTSLRACMTSSPFTLFPSDLWKTHNILLFCNLAGTQESIATVFHPTSLSSMMHEIMVSKSVCVHPFGKIKETHRRGWLRPTMNGCPCMHSCQWWCCKWQPCYICSDKHNLLWINSWILLKEASAVLQHCFRVVWCNDSLIISTNQETLGKSSPSTTHIQYGSSLCWL
jgi:hypothetical protein